MRGISISLIERSLGMEEATSSDLKKKEKPKGRRGLYIRIKDRLRSFETAEEALRKWRSKFDWSEIIPKYLSEVKFCHGFGGTFFCHIFFVFKALILV